MTEDVTTGKSWALYVFFGANVPEPEVREAAVQNLLQMATVGSSDKISVAAQLHLPGPWAYRYVMGQRPPGPNPVVVAPIETIPNRNSANPYTVIEFFHWAAKICPADNIILIVWGHGYGIDDYLPRCARPHLPPQTDKFSQTESEGQSKVSGAQVANESVQSSEPQTATENAASASFALQTAESRYIRASIVNIILDECDHEVLPNLQLGMAAHACKKSLPIDQKLAILALDACTMAMVEVWCELEDCAQIGIASQAQEPDASFPYDRILARLILQPDASPERVSQMIVDAFVESYAYQADAFVTLSACDLSKGSDQAPLRVLVRSTKQLAAELTNAAKDPVDRSIIFQARNACPIFDVDGFIDLARFCEIVEVTLSSPDVSKACKQVRQSVNSFIQYARYSPLDPTLRISQTTGVSIWFPPWLEDPCPEIPEQEASIAYLVNGYGKTAFASQTGWDVFLKSMWQTRRCGTPCPE